MHRTTALDDEPGQVTLARLAEVVRDLSLDEPEPVAIAFTVLPASSRAGSRLQAEYSHRARSTSVPSMLRRP